MTGFVNSFYLYNMQGRFVSELNDIYYFILVVIMEIKKIYICINFILLLKDYFCEI